MRNILQITCAAMIVMGLVGCGGSAADEDSLAIRGEECEWRFLPVEGESQLPLTFMRTGEAREKTESVNLPRFWIAERPVTEREYASVMGMSVRERCAADQPASDMSWLEAYKFCVRFNEKYGDQLPKGYMLSLPTMIDWAHAVRRLAGKVDFCDSVGTFLFQGAVKHGFLATYDGSTIAENPEVDVAIDYDCIVKCWQSVQIGIRPVLIPIDMSYQGANAWQVRASVLCYQYLLNEAKELIEKARQISPLSQEEFQKIFGNDLDFIQNADYKYNHEDWSGIVSVSARYAEEQGYQARQFVYLWMLLNWYDEPFSDDEQWAAFYRKAGIVGTLKSPSALPVEVRPSAEALVSYAEDGADTNRLQVLECDFTGDGRTDLVVEGCSVGASGYWYNFCQQKQDGSYTNVLSLQTVGLCAIPPKKGGAVGFIAIEKTGNPYLTSSLLTFDAEGKPSFSPVSSKEFYMLDAEKDILYRAAPFIGGGLGMGWYILAERGVWYRPLYWPWEGIPSSK